MEQRKSDHIKICLEKDVGVDHKLSGFDSFAFIHNALPEIDKKEINIRTKFLNKWFESPLLISSMTGGTEEAKWINRNLAKAAQNLNIGLGLGSARIIKHDNKTIQTFKVRDIAPHILLVANLGAVQLNYGFGLKECEVIVKEIKADALILHLNPLQEAIQTEGNTDFSDLLDKIMYICENLSVPVIVKEIGCGISYSVAKKLKDAGVSAIDVAGLGGTSFALIEGYRSGNKIGETFKNWGIPTTSAIKQVKKIGLPLIASGGIRNGLDVAKSIALGADIIGIGLPLLKPATRSAEDVEKVLKKIIEELKIAMFCVGTKNIKELKKVKLIKVA